MKSRETGINLSMGQLILTNKKDVGMQSSTLITFLITQTPVDETGQIKKSRFYSSMVKTMLNRIINGNQPFARTSQPLHSPLLKL